MFTVLFAYVFFLLVLWLGICVEVDVDTMTILRLSSQSLHRPISLNILVSFG